MLKDFSFQAAFVGVLAAVVGTASTVAIVLTGLRAVGATEAQAATGLMVMLVATGIAGVFTAVVSRAPIGIAWSVPGAALMAASGQAVSSFSVAVGSLLLCAVLIVASGLIRPFGRLIEAIPRPLASAMIAGVLFQFCLKPFVVLEDFPLVGALILATWVLVGWRYRLWAVPAAVGVFIVCLPFVVDPNLEAGRISLFAPLRLVWPTFDAAAVISLGVPLFVVTMAGQNIPGIAAMQANDYPVKAGPWFTLTGVFSALGALGGSVPINLAAITAAMMAGEESHRDRHRRYWAAIVAGIAYLLFGIFAGGIVALLVLAPLPLVQAVAGLALVPALMGNLATAFRAQEGRQASAVAFLFGASGAVIWGISGAFWGLLIGLAIGWATTNPLPSAKWTSDGQGSSR